MITNSESSIKSTEDESIIFGLSSRQLNSWLLGVALVVFVLTLANYRPLGTDLAWKLFMAFAWGVFTYEILGIAFVLAMLPRLVARYRQMKKTREEGE